MACSRHDELQRWLKANQKRKVKPEPKLCTKSKLFYVGSFFFSFLLFFCPVLQAAGAASAGDGTDGKGKLPWLVLYCGANPKVEEVRPCKQKGTFFCFLFFFSSSGGWGRKITLELTTLPRTVIHVVRRFILTAFAIKLVSWRVLQFPVVETARAVCSYRRSPLLLAAASAAQKGRRRGGGGRGGLRVV